MSTRTAPRRPGSRGPSGGGRGAGKGQQGPRPGPFSAAGAASRAASRTKKAEEVNKRARARMETWRRRWSYVQTTAAVAWLVGGGLWSAGSWSARRTARGARATYRHVLAPAGRLAYRRVLAPVGRRVSHRARSVRDGARDWRDDVAAFGWGARARDCDRCDHRLPHWQWVTHQWDAHGVDVPPEQRGRPARPGGTARPDRVRVPRWLGGRGGGGDDIAPESWTWHSTVTTNPWATARAWFVSLPSQAREAWRTRGHGSLQMQCGCGWVGPARDLPQHYPCQPRPAGGPVDAPVIPVPSARSSAVIDSPPTPHPGPPVIPRPVAHPSLPGHLMPPLSGPLSPSRGGAPMSQPAVLAGSEVIASAPGTLQIHDLPELLEAAAGHARAEAQVIAAAWQRCGDAEGTDSSVSEALQRALTCQLAVAQALERAAEHARYLSAIAHDFRYSGPRPVVTAIASRMSPPPGGYAIAPGTTGVAMSGGQLQVHDLPPMLGAAHGHVSGETDMLVAAFARMQSAENADATISGHLATAASMQHAVSQEFARGRDAATRIAAVTPDFRKGVRR